MNIILRIFRRIGIGLSMIVLALAGHDKVFSYFAQRSGPFALYKDAPGDGEFFERATRALYASVIAQQNGADALAALTKAGFACDQHTLETARTDWGRRAWQEQEESIGRKIGYVAACDYRFRGFWGPGGKWGVSLRVDPSGNIIDIRQTVFSGELL